MVDRVIAQLPRPFDYQARDSQTLLDQLLALVPEKLPEWTDTSEGDFGRVILELVAHLGDVVGYYTDAAANESFLGTAQSRRSIIHHLRLIGYELSTAAPAAAALTVTAPVVPAGPVEVGRGDAFATASTEQTPSVRFEYNRSDPLVITPADWVPDGDGNQVATVAIPVEEGRLITDEILGDSDGSPNQRFALAHPRLILRPPGAGDPITPDIEVISEIAAIPTGWTRQDTLAFSGVNELDYVVEIDHEDRAEIVFGAAVPAAGAEIRATYRVGGGPQGNVPRDRIQTIAAAPALTALGVSLTNPEPATNGAARETIEQAVEQAPSVFRSLRRAVTGADYEALALGYAGVGKVRAVATSWNVVTLYVAPAGGGFVSDVLTAGLIGYFEDRRPLSTRIEVENVEYVPVFVTCDVTVEAYFSNDEIAAQVRSAVRDILAFDNVDFADQIFLSKFYERIEAIDGVAGVNIAEFRRPGETDAIHPEGKLVMGPNQLARVPEGDDFDLHPDGATAADYAGGVAVSTEGGF